MKNKIKELLKDSFIKTICRVYFFIIVAFLAVFIWKWRQLPPQLPLFYSLPRSEEQLGTPYLLLILPLLSVVVFFLHFWVAFILFRKENLAAKILITSAVIFSLTLLFTFIKIVFLIT